MDADGTREGTWDATLPPSKLKKDLQNMKHHENILSEITRVVLTG